MSHSDNAHAARVDSGVVRQVIVIPYCDDDDATITAYCNGVGLDGIWLDCSYLGSRRGHYPGVGFRYDEASDQYIPPNWEYVEGEWIAPLTE